MSTGGPLSSSASKPAEVRIASVQHGDYLLAKRRLAGGGPETYGHQRYSIDALEAVLANRPHLIVSLDGQRSSEAEGLGLYVTIPERGPRWLPRRWACQLRAREVLSIVARFAPTHLLLRTGDI